MHPPDRRTVTVSEHTVRPRRLRALALVLTAAAAAACGVDAPGAAGDADYGEHPTLAGGPPGGTLVVLSEREPDELNPLTFSSNPAYQVTQLVFRALARRDTTLSDYVPHLARSWEMDSDSTLVIRLRDDVRWHDGVPVTADDLLFTIERQRDERTASPRRNDVLPVRGAEALDSFTVRLLLRNPGPYTVNALLEVVTVPRHLLDTVPAERMRFAAFGRAPVGNGYYRFGSWQAGQSVTLEANPDVPEGRPAPDRIVLRFVPDMNAAMTELLAAQGDLLKIPPDQRDRVQASANVELAHGPRVRPAWIAWNTASPPVDDVRVRRAVLMAIDRDALARALFGGEGEAALSPIPPALAEHSPDVRPIPHDPAGAARLLDEAGWSVGPGGTRQRGGQPLRLEIDYIATDQARADVVVAMQAMLRRVGVELVPRAYESTTWVERLRGREFQGSLWGWGWGPGVVGTNAEMIFHSRSIPPAGPNFAGYSNPRVDALLDSVLVEFDAGRRTRLWREIEQQAIDDAVYAPLYLDPELYGVASRIGNARFHGIEWSENVPFWFIAPDRRLPRDRTQ
jgi:peptide/nickel transport system substrate-binding protein